MKKGERVFYEWALEMVDEHGDIIDADFATNTGYASAWRKESPVDCVRHDVALVRRVGSDADGEQERGYAYVRPDGTLPDRFTCGAKVPQSWRDEWTAANA
jgi:hypothetical protein